MNRLKKIIATVLSVMLVLTSIMLPALANEDSPTEYVSVTNNATSHKSSATATATNYETDSNNYLVDGNPSTMYGTGPAASAYFTFIDLGEGGRRVDKVVITTNDPMGDRVIGQKYYLANTVPVNGADRSGWVYLGTRTENRTAMTFILTEQQAGTYRYVVADCTDSTVGGYVNEIEVYKDASYVEPVIAKNVAKGKSVTPSVAGMSGYDNPAVITDGVLFATSSTNQFIITTRPSLVCIDLAGSYSVSKVVIDAVTTAFTKNVDVYLSDTAANGNNVPSGATKVLTGDVNGWSESVKTLTLDTAVDAQYVIICMTTDASHSFRLSEVEVWGVPATGDSGGSGGSGDSGGSSGSGDSGGSSGSGDSGGSSGSGDSDDTTAYISVTDNATSHKSSATATATNYEKDPNNRLVDGDPSTVYGTGPADGAYFTFIDLGEGGRRVDKVVITTNDTTNGARVIGQKYYLANTVPVNGADRSGWVYLGTRTENGTAMTFILTEQQAGIYRYVVADCTDSTVGGYVNEIEAYMDYNAYLAEEGKPFILTDKTSSVSANVISYSGTLINGSGNRTIVGLFGTRGTNGEYVETAYDQATATGAGVHNVEMSAAVTSNSIWDAVFLSGLDFVKGFSNLADRTAILQKSTATGVTPVPSRIGNTVTFTGKTTGSVVGMVVLKTGATFESYTDSDIVEHKMIYAPTNATGAWDFAINYSFADALPTGDYKLGFFCDNGDTAISGKQFTVSKIDLSAVVTAFETVTADNFATLLASNTAFFGDIATLLDDTATMGQSYVLAKNAMMAGDLDSSVTAWNADALAKVAQAAIVVDNTLHTTNFASSIAPYIGSMPEVFGTDYNAAEFEQIVPVILTNTTVTTAADLVNLYDKANALSLIANGSVEDAEKAIKENSTLLGISAETLAKASALQIAKKLDTSMATVLGTYVAGMETAVSAIVTQIQAEDGNGGQQLGGGGSGGGGGSNVSSGMVAPGNADGENTVGKVENIIDKNDSSASDAAKKFNDISGFEWAADAIGTLSERGIVNGKGSGKFDPSGILTREEAVKILVTATGTPTDESYNGYKDCEAGSWYYPYITAAKINDLVTGFSRTQFGLGSSVTRQDLAVMLYRAMVKEGLVDGSEMAGFTDEAKISDYAVDAVKVLGGMKIITGFEDGSFAPESYATRAETAVIFARYLELADAAEKEAAE